jgi:hypothetical protein
VRRAIDRAPALLGARQPAIRSGRSALMLEVGFVHVELLAAHVSARVLAADETSGYPHRNIKKQGQVRARKPKNPVFQIIHPAQKSVLPRAVNDFPALMALVG